MIVSGGHRDTGLDNATDQLTGLTQPHAAPSIAMGRCRHDPTATVTSLFRQTVQSSPDAVAVITREGRLTYAEVESAAAKIAAALRSLGVEAGDRVGVRCGRHPLMPSALLGVLGAGAAFVPIDPDTPPARAIELLARAGCRTEVHASGGPSDGFRGLDLNAEHVQPGGSCPSGAWTDEPAPSDAASVMFTSGSTGRPKGALIPHRAIVRLCQRPNFLQAGPSTRFLHAAPLGFDASTLEIWTPILNGGQVVLAPDRAGLREITALIEREKINTVWLTAALFHACVDDHPGLFSSLSTVLTGGDVVSPAHAARLRNRYPRLSIINGYGPTENTTFTTCHAVGDHVAVDAALPIGTPVSGTGVRIVDGSLRSVPRGTPGELIATGAGLALGYLDDEEETNRRFVTLPDDGQRGYRTGDRAVMHEDGTVSFLGRMDDQLKVRGYRIEPAEVERAIRREPGVRDAAVVKVSNGTQDALQAFVVLDDGATWPDGRRAMADRLAETLPPHLVPSFIARRDALPVGPTGKVDRPALRAHVELGWPVEADTPDIPKLADPSVLAAAAAVLAARWQPLDAEAHASIVYPGGSRVIERPGDGESLTDLVDRVRAGLEGRIPENSEFRILLTDPEGSACEIRPGPPVRLRLTPETSEHIARWRAEHLRRALAAIAELERAPLSDLVIVGDDERSRIEQVWNDTGRDHGPDLSLIDLFERSAERHAERQALADEALTLSYRRLSRRVHAVADQLRTAGVRHGDRVALMDRRNAESVVGVLGILRAGAACVPITPEIPPGRLQLMLDACDAALLVEPDPAAVPAAAGRTVRVPLIAQTTGEIDPGESAALSPQSEAFVLFTPSADGTPRAVPVRHESLRNQVLWMSRVAAIDAGDTVAQKNRLSWEVALAELFLPLLAGAQSFVIGPETAADPKRLVSAARSQGITVWHVVPSLLCAVAEALKDRPGSSLRCTLCSGEHLTAAEVSAYLRAAPGTLISFYGTTESAGEVTSWRCTPEAETVPIGRPADNTRIRVLDGSGRPAPAGVVGLLEIEGIAVSRGYLNAPGDSFSAAAMGRSNPRSFRYRTGDLGWWREDGTIGYMGRRDGLVRLLGFRIEVTEVESEIRKCPGVTDAAVCVTGRGMNAQIVAVCASEAAQVDSGVESVIRDRLGSSLEPHAIPTRFVWTDSIPRLPGGKPDRRRVTALAEARPSPPAPESHIASDPIAAVRAAWARVLGQAPVSDEIGLRRAGGNSLALLRMLLDIESVLGVERPVMTQLTDPSPRDLADVFERAMMQDRGDRLRGAELRRNAAGHLHQLSDGDNAAIVLPHLGGAIGFLGDVARACAGRVAIFAIQPAGLVERELPLRSVGEMVQGYAELVASQGRSCVTIAGFSSGAPLAMELAIELEARGLRVPRLIAVDGIPVHRPPAPERFTRVYAAMRRRVPPRHLPLWAPGPRHRNLAQWEPLQRRLGEATLEALYHHRPTRYHGPATVIRRRRADLALGLDSWKRVLRGPTKEILIDCESHMGLWRQPHCEPIVRAFLDG